LHESFKAFVDKKKLKEKDKIRFVDQYDLTCRQTLPNSILKFLR